MSLKDKLKDVGLYALELVPVYGILQSDKNAENGRSTLLDKRDMNLDLIYAAYQVNCIVGCIGCCVGGAVYGLSKLVEHLV